MKHIPYRQNPTVIDTSKKSPTTTGGNYACIYELSNHLNTTHNTNAPVRAFRTGAFCFFKNFLKKSLLPSWQNLSRVRRGFAKGEK